MSGNLAMATQSEVLELPKSTRVHIIDNASDCDEILAPLIYAEKSLKTGEFLPYGLDSEWIAENTVALIQIALPKLPIFNKSSDNDLENIVLLRMSEFSSHNSKRFLPDSLITLFKSTKLVAVGVGVRNDIRLICSQWQGVFNSQLCNQSNEENNNDGSWCVNDEENVETNQDLLPSTDIIGPQYLELQQLAARCMNGEKECQGFGLKALCLKFLNKDLSKDSDIRCGNWAAKILSSQQINYAAIDAYSSLAILRSLKQQFSGIVNGVVEDFDDEVSWCLNLIKNIELAELRDSEVGTKSRRRRNKSNTSIINNNNNNSSSSSNRYFVPKRRCHYDGCKMYAPNDNHLCNITARRAEWYVKNNLASLLCLPPHEQHACSIKLNFTPKGLKTSSFEDIFQRADRENKCVGCGKEHKYSLEKKSQQDQFRRNRIGNSRKDHCETGTSSVTTTTMNSETTMVSLSSTSSSSSSSSTSSSFLSHSPIEGLNRFSIVPHCFRKHMPRAVKSRSSHDIVLLCHSCRDIAQAASSHHRAKLLSQHNLTTHIPPPPIDQTRKAVRSAANALFVHRLNQSDVGTSSSLTASSSSSSTSEISTVTSTSSYSSSLSISLQESKTTTMQEKILHVQQEGKTKRNKKKSGIPPQRVMELEAIICLFLQYDSNSQISIKDLNYCKTIPLFGSLPCYKERNMNLVIEEKEIDKDKIHHDENNQILKDGRKRKQELNDSNTLMKKNRMNDTVISLSSPSMSSPYVRPMNPEEILMQKLGLAETKQVLSNAMYTSHSNKRNNNEVGEEEEEAEDIVDENEDQEDDDDKTAQGNSAAMLENDEVEDEESIVQCQQFVETWRRVFLEAVKPKNMPVGWKLTRPVIWK